MLREAARILAEKKRVIIVDTSNEIGGDGDVPHPAVGRARRMQVAQPSLQHEVMIEAVENHNPEVIVIDEIGRELEAQAARTIAERGVQLIGTAHGRTLENLLLNPTLSDLVGGIESVTLSDEEARRRGTQKTVLERRAPPTFDVLIEIQERDRLTVHADVATAVDTLVRGAILQADVRSRDAEGRLHVEKSATQPQARGQSAGMRRLGGGEATDTPAASPFRRGSATIRQPEAISDDDYDEPVRRENRTNLRAVRVYPYGVARNRLMQATKRLGVPASVVRDVSEADVIMTLRSYYRNRMQTLVDAEQRGKPIYVLRANTVSQMEQSLAEMFNLGAVQPAPDNNDMDDATQETLQAIQAVMSGQRWADLPPASASVRRMQHDMAREAHLVSHSYGKEPHRRVRIFRE